MLASPLETEKHHLQEAKRRPSHEPHFGAASEVSSVGLRIVIKSHPRSSKMLRSASAAISAATRESTVRKTATSTEAAARAHSQEPKLKSMAAHRVWQAVTKSLLRKVASRQPSGGVWAWAWAVPEG